MFFDYFPFIFYNCFHTIFPLFFCQKIVKKYISYIYFFPISPLFLGYSISGRVVATNWPIEKALHAIGYNQIPTK